jgi:hypothetical protein
MARRGGLDLGAGKMSNPDEAMILPDGRRPLPDITATVDCSCFDRAPPHHSHSWAPPAPVTASLRHTSAAQTGCSAMRDGRYLVTEIKGVNAMSLSGSVAWSTPGGRLPLGHERDLRRPVPHRGSQHVGADRRIQRQRQGFVDVPPARRRPAQPPLTGAAASRRRHLRH